MYYPDEVIEEIRSKTNIVDIIGERIGLKQKGREYWCNCPFHNEKTPSFHVMPDRQMYHCFGCHAGGNVYTFLMQYENYSFQEAVEYLAERAGVTLPKTGSGREDAAKRDRKYKLYEVNKTAAAYYHYVLTKTKQGELGREYFQENRKLSPETVGKFALGYTGQGNNALYHYLKGKGFDDQTMMDAGLIQFSEKYGVTDTFWNRVIIPIVDKNSKVIAFGGRVLGDALPKYINTKETDIYNKRDNLFALNLARRSRRNGFILCEGYMDVISMHQAGFDNAVASLGTAFTEEQANLLRRFTDIAYLAYDSDGAGTQATLKAIRILRDYGISQRVIDMKPYKDPDEFIKALGSDAFEERIKNSQPGRMFEIDVMTRGVNMDDPDEKTKVMHNAGRIIAGIDDAAERINYIESICRKYNFDVQAMKTITSKYFGTVKDAEAYKQREEDMRREKKERTDNSIVEHEAMLLTLFVTDPNLIEKLKPDIREEDFTEGVYRLIIHELYQQMESAGKVNPAAIFDRFDDVEDQKMISRIINRAPKYESEEMKSKMITDVVRKIKLSSIEAEMKQATDSQRLMQLMNDLKKYKNYTFI